MSVSVILKFMKEFHEEDYSYGHGEADSKEMNENRRRGSSIV